MPDNGYADARSACMVDVHLFHQPTLRQLLNSEALAEAQVVYGGDMIDCPVTQVVANLSAVNRSGSLAVCRMEAVLGVQAPALKGLSGLAVVKNITTESLPPLASSAGAVANPTPVNALGVDAPLKRIIKLCTDEGIACIVIPGFGDPAQVADDVRMAFLRELKLSSARLHSTLLARLLDDGLDGLVEEISTRLNRPVVIETADFKVLASINMGATPSSQQRFLAEEASKAVRRRFTSHEKLHNQDVCLSPLKIGRRLVLPVLLSESLVGFIAVMVRPNDDMEMVGEYLQAAALAAMVEFSQRRRDGSVFTVTQQSLLKDLLSGNTLSASDQERLERHYGFDLCDGLFMFAVEATVTGGGFTRLPEDGFASTEIEGTRVFVVPYFEKSETTWQKEAQLLIDKIKSAKTSSDALRIQVGAARLAQTIVDLPEAYKEARQALIIGSMVHGDADFVIGYGELGIKRLLYLLIDHPELERFYEDNLAPLEAYDTEWESELVPSLRIYLQEGANLNSAARALFIHRHTLRYRLEQIADILKVDIDSQEVLLNLQIAYLIRDMKNNIRGKGRI